MNLFDFFNTAFQKVVKATKPTPAEFRRGYRKHRVIGYLVDPFSKHVGEFRGGITPMRRRFKGVSRTAGK